MDTRQRTTTVLRFQDVLFLFIPKWITAANVKKKSDGNDRLLVEKGSLNFMEN
jgi:hypothetical protein